MKENLCDPREVIIFAPFNSNGNDLRNKLKKEFDKIHFVDLNYNLKLIEQRFYLNRKN